MTRNAEHMALMIDETVRGQWAGMLRCLTKLENIFLNHRPDACFMSDYLAELGKVFQQEYGFKGKKFLKGVYDTVCALQEWGAQGHGGSGC